ncbi:MAG: GTPase, partial [Planctomycetota bacterium]
RQKAIVTDIKGTTRDWVSGYLIIEPLFLELIDTAGLDKELKIASNIDKKSQQKSTEILEAADLVLLVLDGNQPIYKPDKHLLEKTSQKKVLTVLNKSDLPFRLDAAKLPEKFSNCIKISAKNGMGIEKLRGKISELCEVKKIDWHLAVCITSRQEKLLAELINSKSKQSAISIIEELLNGRVCV